MSDEGTIKVYDAKADEYAKSFTPTKPGQHLEAFMAGLNAGACVLDLGCGTGGATTHLVNAGFDVTGIDASRAMLDVARSHSDATFVHGQFSDLADVALYDGIWANFSLLHANRSDLPGHLKAINTALKPKGLFHIGMKTGTGAKRDGLDRFYTYYEEEELVGHLKEAGLEVFKRATGTEKGLAGTLDPWVIMLARKSN